MTQSPYDVAHGFAGHRETRAQSLLNEFLNNGGTGLSSAEFAWCSRFVKRAAERAGVDASQANDAARSFLKVGQPVDKPQRGDVVVLNRPEGGPDAGHVGFYEGAGSRPGTIRLLSGNHGDRVASADYTTDRVLGYRRLTPGQGQMQDAAPVHQTNFGRDAQKAAPDNAFATDIAANPPPGFDEERKNAFEPVNPYEVQAYRAPVGSDALNIQWRRYG